jgi:prevent-host-death family protein
MQQDSEGPSMKTMSATAASKEFGRFIDAAQREPVLLTKKDRPVAVTVSVADWEEGVKCRWGQNSTITKITH